MLQNRPALRPSPSSLQKRARMKYSRSRCKSANSARNAHINRPDGPVVMTTGPLCAILNGPPATIAIAHLCGAGGLFPSGVQRGWIRETKLGDRYIAPQATAMGL